MRVLIVEDEFLIAELLKNVVQDYGYETIGPVSTVEQALAYAPRADIALVDLGLSDGHSGHLLARRLIDRFGIDVIFVTGDPGAVQQGFDGALAVVRKPFRDEEIADALARAFDKRSRSVARPSGVSS
ncbi:response regulator [Shinella sp. BYT-45]|uniref:response regulator n=1 Tax=Shinella sp. BYT-45 TaxID=3377377 RepID=UPI003980E4F6